MNQDTLSSTPVRYSAIPVACVDIGGTKVAVTCVDTRGAHARLSEPTCKTGSPDALAEQVIRLVNQSCAAAGVSVQALAAVGVAACGPFVVQGGLIDLAAPNICGGLASSVGRLPNDWTSAPLEGWLQSAFKNVRIENDAVAALAAERRWGALQGAAHSLGEGLSTGLPNCAYVTWSTGVGVGLCVDGHILRGKNGNAGHAGHQFVSDNLDAICGCGNLGDVEALAGGLAISKRFAANGYTSAAALLDAAQAGEPAALRITDDLCRVMGRMLYNLVVTLDLQRISIGGSVFWMHRDFLLPRLTEQLRGKLPALTTGCDLVPAGLGQQVGDYAALALALALVD
jgi:glucokinase